MKIRRLEIYDGNDLVNPIEIARTSNRSNKKRPIRFRRTQSKLRKERNLRETKMYLQNIGFKKGTRET